MAKPELPSKDDVFRRYAPFGRKKTSRSPTDHSEYYLVFGGRNG